MSFIVLAAVFAAAPAVEEGKLEPTFPNRKVPKDAAHLTPPARPFAFRREEVFSDAVISGSRLTFPSPVTSPYECNNTVWCEYFAPRSAGKHPAVVVLHFLNDPNFTITRLVCDNLARRGIASLMLKMAYYGERRPTGIDPEDMVDLEFFARAVAQSAQDTRCALAWLRSRPEVDPERAGILGISLGAMVGSLVTAIDANLKRSVLIVGGGNLHETVWSAPETRRVRAILTERGIDRARTAELLAPVEPLGFAAPLPAGTVLMINSRKDVTVPPPRTEALARAFGLKDEIVWYDTTHSGLAAHLTEVLDRVAAFLKR